MDATLEEGDLRINFNAVLTSGGGSLTERQFLSDYRALIGGNVPYEKLGHRSLRSFIEYLGGFYYTRNTFGESIIHAGFDEKTAHITSLIARQKKKPGSKGRKRPSFARPKLPPRLTPLRQPSYPPRSYPAPVQTRSFNPPKPKYGNPPIIPQRQPSLSVQKRLEMAPAPTPLPPAPVKPTPVKPTPVTPMATPKLMSVQERLSREGYRGVSVDIRQAKNQILSVNPHDANSVDVDQFISHTSRIKDPSLHEEPPKDASFVDIQWLQGKVCKRRSEREVPIVKTAPNPCAKATSKPVQEVRVPEPVPAISQPRKVQSSIQSPPVPLMSIPIPELPLQSLSAPLNISSKNKSRSRLQKIVFKSHIEELQNLVRELKLSDPEYKKIEVCSKWAKPVYIAKLRIGKDEQFSSFPEERHTYEEAQELVAKIACENLRKRYILSINPGTEAASPEPVSDDLIEQRIYQIVESKMNGTFEEAISQAYESEFKYPLPSTWLTIVENSNKFSIINQFQRAIIYPVPEDQRVLSRDASRTSLSMNNAISPKPEVMKPLTNGIAHAHSSDSASKQELFVDINANTLLEKPHPPGEAVPARVLPKLVLPPAQPTWDVFVTSVSNNDVWVRLIGEDYDAKYNEVMNEMEMKMMSTTAQTAVNPQLDDYFAVNFDNCWLRVQLKEIMSSSDEGDECIVFLIDNGEMDTIRLSELKVLDYDYLSLPPQAVQCRLSYVDLTREEAQSFMLSQVIGSSFVAVVLQPPTEDTIPSIVLHNTEVEEPININYLILDKIVEKMSLPQPPLRNVAFMCRVTHIENGTLPFLQIEGKDLSLLENILEEISKQDLIQEHGVNAHPRLMHVNSKNKHLYLVRSAEAPKTWRRAVIENAEDARNVLVYFIDHGYQERVMLSDIFDLGKVLPVLMKFPAQAVQFNLSNIAPSKLVGGIVKRFRELVPPSMPIIGKVTDLVASVNLPTVELFKRLMPNNVIVSINSDLLFHYDEYSRVPEEPDRVSEHTGSIQLRGPCDSTSPLSSYSVPPVGSDFFDVFVSLSSNPFNFVVQPVKELNSSFNQMMQELQEQYEAQHHIMKIPHVEDLKENNVFVAKHPDDLQWYRVSIVTVLNENMVSVKYSDYGDVGLVPTDRIRYLDSKFLQLPALAVKAKLHGVKPKNIDWSVDECIFFNECVENKPFVSKVFEVTSESNTGRVSLQLIDTTKENKDVDVASLLVEKGMADWIVEKVPM